MVRRPIADYVHRFTVIALLGLTVCVFMHGSMYLTHQGMGRLAHGSRLRKPRWSYRESM